MGEVHHIRTRKNERPPEKAPIVWLLVIGLAIAGIIAGAIYLGR